MDITGLAHVFFTGSVLIFLGALVYILIPFPFWKKHKEIEKKIHLDRGMGIPRK